MNVHYSFSFLVVSAINLRISKIKQVKSLINCENILPAISKAQNTHCFLLKPWFISHRWRW